MKKLKNLILAMLLVLTGGALLVACDDGVTITSKELDTSSVDTNVSYFDPLDYSGVSGKITYSDGNSITLTSQNVKASEIDYTKSGATNVVFSYEDVELKTVSVEVQTYAFYVDSSNVDKMLTAGSAVDLSGLKVWTLDEEEGYVELQKVENNDGQGYTLDVGNLNLQNAQEGTYEIKVSYNGNEEKFNIIVTNAMDTNLQDEKGNQILFNTMTYKLTGGGWPI